MEWYWNPESLWARVMPDALMSAAPRPFTPVERTACSASSTRNSVTSTPWIRPPGRTRTGAAAKIRGVRVTDPISQSEAEKRPARASWK